MYHICVGHNDTDLCLRSFVVDDPRHAKSYPSTFYWNGEPTAPESSKKREVISDNIIALRGRKKRRNNTEGNNDVNEDPDESSASKIFMFTLRVTDGTMTTDLIAFDKVPQLYPLQKC
jgi:hypothetical protein